jgi:hypothetical protein
LGSRGFGKSIQVLTELTTYDLHYKNSKKTENEVGKKPENAKPHQLAVFLNRTLCFYSSV